jgi:hypothetical protein
MLYLEGRDVTASQELDAMEDDAPSRLHLGFTDPLHSMVRAAPPPRAVPRPASAPRARPGPGRAEATHAHAPHNRPRPLDPPPSSRRRM